MAEAAVNPSIFRAYDVRGKVPSELDEAAAGLIGQALATVALGRGMPRIAVARDGRTSSPGLAAALAEGINAMGIDTLDLGMLPTPVAYWGAQDAAKGCSAVVTGSHNPREYNGIKMALGGVPLAGKDIEELRAVIESGRTAGKGVAGIAEEEPGVAGRYIDAVAGKHRLSRKVRAVVDCGNGVAGPFYPKALEAIGCEVTALFADVDGTFPNHHPDPADPESYGVMAGMLDAGEAEIGLAFDGDGDRLGAWLPGTGQVYPDRLLMLLARDMLLSEPGAKVLYDVKCSVNVAPFVTSCGGEPVLCRTGHSFVKREMAASGARLGGELSGHFFFNEPGWSFDDALLAAARLLVLIARADSAAELCATVPDSCATPEYTVPMPGGASPHEFVEGLKAAGGLPGDPELVTVDGIRAVWEDAFGLVRASNTTPSLILRFEGVDAAARDRAQEAFRGLLLGSSAELRLPF